MKSKQLSLIEKILLGVLIAAGVFIAFLTQMTVDGNTPEWLINAQTYALDFVEVFNALTVVTLVLVGLGWYVFSRKIENKQNRSFLRVVFWALVAYGAYILLLPPLANAFSDQQWLVDFSTHASDVQLFIESTNGFLSAVAAIVIFLYFIFKKNK